MLGGIRARWRRRRRRKPRQPQAAASRPGGLQRLRDAAGGARDRVTGLRYVFADLAYVLARLPRSVGRGVAGFWTALPPTTRRRLVAATGVAAALILLATVVVPNLPCQFPGGDRCPPPDDAIELVPAEALAYVHVNLDRETEQLEAARELLGRMPLVGRQLVEQAVPLIAGPDGGFEPAAQPWFAGELATVLIPVAGGTEQVTFAETNDSGAAREYAAAAAGSPADTDRHRGTDIDEFRGDSASAVIDGFLVTGSKAGIREVVDVATGAEEAPPLAGDQVATDALDALPDHRLAEAYLASDGIAALVADPEGPLASVEPLIDANGSRGAAVALVAGGSRLELAVRSLLDPEAAESEPGFFGAFDQFEAELPDRLAPDTLAYVGIASPSETLTALLGQATVRTPGIAAGFTRLIGELRRAAGIDLERDLLGALGGEAAFALVPRDPGGDEDEILAPAGDPVPFLEFIAADVDEEAAREALARVQAPIAEAADPELGGAGFATRRIGDVEAQVLRLSPVAELIYAFSEGQLVIANDPAAVERLADEPDEGLADAESYERAMGDLPDERALGAYLNLRELLVFAERSGLAEDTAYATFASDLRRLESLGLVVSRDDAVLATDGRLLID